MSTTLGQKVDAGAWHGLVPGFGNELIGPWDAGGQVPMPGVYTVHPADMPCTLKTLNKDSLNHDG